jgi:hypothetical protein
VGNYEKEVSAYSYTNTYMEVAKKINKLPKIKHEPLQLLHSLGLERGLHCLD